MKQERPQGRSEAVAQQSEANVEVNAEGRGVCDQTPK